MEEYRIGKSGFGIKKEMAGAGAQHQCQCLNVLKGLEGESIEPEELRCYCLHLSMY